MRHLFSSFFADQSGATAIEYALLAAGISLAIMVAVQSVGPVASDKYSTVNDSLK